VGFYSRYVLPNIIACGCAAPSIKQRRAGIVPDAAGVVLELGFGSGLNLPFYDPAKVAKVYALEPEPGMLVKARRTARDASLPVEVLAETAEALSLPAGSVDTVLVTFALCTIPDAVSALSAARRALKPGGRLLFCEHGRAPDADIARTQAKLDPTWGKLFGGCHLTRDIPALVRTAGYHIERLDEGYMPKSPRFAGYTYCGAAVSA
jgi:ubiquinone/menaquinone biosynthesis C-methylase UbiE